jgi:hypothetical protein
VDEENMSIIAKAGSSYTASEFTRRCPDPAKIQFVEMDG